MVKQFVPLGLSSRDIATLLSFSSITEYEEKDEGKEFPPEHLPNTRPHSPYYILKVSGQSDEFLLRCSIREK
jgi:hypothetical protein